ncbi:MAG: DNA integrity scanning protein DisA nucleotide-binding domain protein, partial [Sphaerochaetaceae bacterium]|nr:DNA integrity scanning protein DisA nucleotide-binding domain protein [Sphaerochaetaceae bacterium]
QMLMTIFAFDTELHDGAVIIQNGRLAAAGCFLPLSHQQDLNQAFGTRHRAALGMSEESDALVLIVSEESGAVSIAFNGTMYYDLEKDTARNMLISLLSAQDVNTSFKEASNEEQ